MREIGRVESAGYSAIKSQHFLRRNQYCHYWQFSSPPLATKCDRKLSFPSFFCAGKMEHIFMKVIYLSSSFPFLPLRNLERGVLTGLLTFEASPVCFDVRWRGGKNPPPPLRTISYSTATEAGQMSSRLFVWLSSTLFPRDLSSLQKDFFQHFFVPECDHLGFFLKKPLCWIGCCFDWKGLTADQGGILGEKKVNKRRNGCGRMGHIFPTMHYSNALSNIFMWELFF